MPETAEAALDLVLGEFVLDVASTRFRVEQKHRAIEATRRAYCTYETFESAIKDRVQRSLGNLHGNFDFAVHDGRAIQLVQCW